MPPTPPRRTSFVLGLIALAALGVAGTAAATTPAGGTLAGSAFPGSTPQAAEACTDFDGYVNGRWAAATELPADRARIGSFDALARANDQLLEKALQDLLSDPARQTSPGLKLLAAHYAAGMDMDAIERQGLAALQPLLARIDALSTRAQLAPLLADLARLQIAAPLALGVWTDQKDVTRHVLNLQQSGLGLPDRDDYLKTDAISLRNQAAYRQYAQTLLAGAGVPAAAADTATIDALMAFEKTLAEASFTLVQRRNPNANYHLQTLAGLRTLAPGLDWTALLQGYAGRSEGLPMVLGQPSFVQALGTLAAEAPLAQWQTYLRVRLLDAYAERLPRRFAEAHFDYYERTLRGVPTPPPRVERLIMAIGGRTGGAPIAQTLGELFVARAFTPQAQARADQMVADIRQAMRQRIQVLPWMSAPTKVLALQKLDAMVPQIGAPTQWRDWSGLALKPDDYAGNHLRISAWATERALEDLGKPVDRLRWNTSPHIVNAFAAGGNRIVFPAGILQPPFFDAGADDATNYGAIGMVIGHEITHHFDDRGRQYDAQGNLRDWWLPADAAAYKERAEKVAALYAGFEPLPGLRLNGHQTLGENISDLSGIQIAYDGLKIALARQRQAGQAPAPVDGLTPEQRFFTAHAIVWRGKYRMEAMQQQVRTGQHSPPRFRILGPLSQTPAFAQAFGCRAGAPMAAAEPIVIW